MHPLTHETPVGHTVEFPVHPFALSLSKGRMQSPARFLI